MGKVPRFGLFCFLGLWKTLLLHVCYTSVMVSPARSFITPQEYLTRERQATSKSEYLNGQVFAMAGASPQHAILSKNLVVALDPQIWRKGCQVYGSDMRVRVESTNLYTYPDVSVVCGKAQFDAKDLDVLLNPVLIAEVLSPTTERYDRVGKFSMYSGITSLREYVLVSQSSVKVERYLRRPGGQWLLTEALRLQDSIKLASVPAVLKLRDLYRQIEF
jgi:Uma2 family endonuclease